MVAGNADEAADVEVDEEQEEGPPHVLNGTGYPRVLRTRHPSIDPHCACPPSSTLPAYTSPFVHVEQTDELDPFYSVTCCMLHKFPITQNV